MLRDWRDEADLVVLIAGLLGSEISDFWESEQLEHLGVSQKARWNRSFCRWHVRRTSQNHVFLFASRPNAEMSDSPDPGGAPEWTAA